jgi:hypothetical protein
MLIVTLKFLRLLLNVVEGSLLPYLVIRDVTSFISYGNFALLRSFSS